MAVQITFDYENAKNILRQSIDNDARPIVILEADLENRKKLASELLQSNENISEISLSEFLTEYVYSIKKQTSLLNYSHIIVNDVKNLRGFSKTLKILSTFIDNMTANNVSVIFMGNDIFYDMSEVIHISGSKIHYIMKIEPERTDEI